LFIEHAWKKHKRKRSNKPTRKLTQCYVNLHVDDFLSTGDPELVKDYRTKLHKRFKMTGGLTEEHYGLDISQNTDGSRSIAAIHYTYTQW
jgi:hypothetical protein